MKWFRSNIKHGSRLAMFALALQFALSFGHFHGTAQASFQPAASSQEVTLAATDAADNAIQQPASHPDPDRQSGEACAICAVITQAGTVLFATTPVLLLPQAVAHACLTTAAGFIDLNSARPSFQPRAPPTA